MRIELTAKIFEANFQLDSFLNRLIGVERLGDQPINFRQELRVLGLNAAAFGRQSWTERYCFVHASAPFLLSEMMLQLVMHLAKDLDDVRASRISIRSVRAYHGVMGLMKHAVHPPVLRDQVVHIAAAFIIVTHGLPSF